MNPRNELSLRLRRACARGFTLLEVTLSIVVFSFGLATFLTAFRDLLPRNPSPANIGIASQLAQERMTLVLEQRARSGYAGITDPCASSSTGICATVTGFTVTLSGLSVSSSWVVDTDTQRYRVISVFVTHSSGTLAREDAILANY